MKNEKKFDFTVVEGLENILQVIKGNREVTEIDVQFLNDRIEKAKNKNKSRASVEKPENEEIMQIVLDILSDKQPKTITEMLKDTRLANYTYQDGKNTKNVTTSKLSTVLQKEVYNGTDENGEKVLNSNSRITRDDKNKKKLLFTLRQRGRALSSLSHD